MGVGSGAAHVRWCGERVKGVYGVDGKEVQGGVICFRERDGEDEAVASFIAAVGWGKEEGGGGRGGVFYMYPGRINLMVGMLLLLLLFAEPSTTLPQTPRD